MVVENIYWSFERGSVQLVLSLRLVRWSGNEGEIMVYFWRSCYFRNASFPLTNILETYEQALEPWSRIQKTLLGHDV